MSDWDGSHELQNGQVRRMLFYSSPSEALEAAGLRQ